MKNLVATSLAETTELDPPARVQGMLRMARRYVASYYHSQRDAALFADVQRYCMFIGHARSGHSIVGALLDAHPHIVLPDEVDALQYVAAGFNREQIFHLLLARSQRQAQRGRTKQGREKLYSYHVPGQWQGRFRTIQVMGDSKAGKSTQRLEQNPALLEQLRAVMGTVQVSLIHVVRNPYDNISTLMIRGGRTFDNALERYFTNCETLADLWARVPPADLLLVRQEDLILQPENTLRQSCHFLGIEAPDDYLAACAGILFKSPARSRHKVSWSAAQIEEVQRRMAPFAFLEGYRYEE